MAESVMPEPPRPPTGSAMDEQDLDPPISATPRERLNLKTTAADLRAKQRIQIWSIPTSILTDHHRSLHAEI
jgi:hypothetical protein